MNKDHSKHTTRIGEAFALALSSINQHRFQSSLTLAGIIMGVATVILVVALIQGLDGVVRSQLSRLNPAGFFLLRVDFTDMGNPDFEGIMKKRPALTIEDARAVREGCPTVRVVSPFYVKLPHKPVSMWYKNQEAQAPFLRGVEEYFIEAAGIWVDRGRFITEADSVHRRNVCVIGRTIAEGLFGAEDPMGKMIHIDGQVYEVIGLLEYREALFGGPNENQLALIPFGTFDKYYSEEDKDFLQFMCLASSPEDVDQAMGEVKEVMRRRRHLTADDPDNFSLFASTQMLDIWSQASTGISVLMIGVASLGLLIGGIGVMNIMLVTVTERTGEIGLRKAVGARRRDVMWQFLLEAMMLTALGGISGVLFGIGSALMVQLFAPSLKASISFGAIVAGLVVSAGVGLFFGLWPAWRAARLNPIQALRYER